MVRLWGDVCTFLHGLDEDVCTKSLKKIRTLLHESYGRLVVELSVIAELGHPLVVATYKLEADGPVVFEAYRIISETVTAVETSSLPQTISVISELAAKGKTLLEKAELALYANTLFTKVKAYLHSVLGDDLSIPLAAFKAVRILHPFRAFSLKITDAHVDSLAIIPCIKNNPQLIAQLKQQRASYLVSAEDVELKIDIQDWWKQNHSQFPAWGQAFKIALTLAPSSASAERVFSILQWILSDRQESMLDDQIELALMLNYNSREPNTARAMPDYTPRLLASLHT